MILNSRSTALFLATTTLTARLPGLLGGAIAVAALAPAALAHTWIVDQAGGPGSHFTDIPPAIAAASPGDVLIIRAGLYSSYTLDKGLTLLGESVATTKAKYTTGGTWIQNLPAGQLAIVAHLNHDGV